MLNGQRVFDADTHIHPTVESLEPYFDAAFRERLPELEQYKVGARSDQTTTPREDPSRRHYAVSLSPYKRRLGDAAPREMPQDAHSRAALRRVHRRETAGRRRDRRRFRRAHRRHWTRKAPTFT